MVRPLRVEFPGACYHMINRGNFRFPVYVTSGIGYWLIPVRFLCRPEILVLDL